MWVNETKVIKSNLKKQKPCYKLGWCPYGCIVEMMPLVQEGKLNCRLFGHHCPMFYNAEDVSEERSREIKMQNCKEIDNEVGNKK